jgi:predicted  nucleic acid-binding Zn-ribbon protein
MANKIRGAGGENMIEMAKRFIGKAPSKEEHSELVRSLRKEASNVEKKIKKTKKLQEKVNTEVLLLQSRLKGINEQMEKSQRIMNGILGGKRRRTYKKTGGK